MPNEYTYLLQVIRNAILGMEVTEEYVCIENAKQNERKKKSRKAG